MKNIEQFISPLIEQQFPEFFSDSTSAFPDFMRAYYEFMELQGSESRNILEYRDIDSTVDAFTDKFKKEYLRSLPASLQSDRALAIKHIQDLYKSKGTPQSYKLLFKMVFDEDIEIYDPCTDILKASDGIWMIPEYIECSASERAKTYVGKIISGISSGAQAFVESIVRKKIQGKLVDVLYLSNIVGHFVTGEYISSDNNLAGAPYITGSLNGITITVGGANNALGDIFSVTADGAKGAKAVVRGIESGAGKVAFTLNDGGYGYQANSNVLISNTVIQFSGNTAAFTPFMVVTQPLQKFNYNALTGNTFHIMDPVTAYDGANNAVANGYVVGLTASNTTAGNLVISNVTGNWGLASTIRQSANSSVNAVFVSTSNATATGTVIKANNSAVGIYNTNGVFYDNAYITAYIGGPIGLSTGNTTSNVITGTSTTYSVNTGDALYFRANGAIIGTVNTVSSNTSIQLNANSNFAFTNTMIWKAETKLTANTLRAISSGSGASYKPGRFSDTETITIDSTFISANNTGSIPFLDILISGSNSNVASNGYGFSANSTVSLNSTILNAFTTNTVSIGTISALSSINIGNNYSIEPLTSVVDSFTSGYDYSDVVLDLSTTNFLFSPGQKIIQNIPVVRSNLTLSANTGAFKISEGVIQNTSGARGVVVFANSSLVSVDVQSGTFVSGNNIIGQASSANGAISAAAIDSAVYTADGRIRNVSGNSVIVKRTSLLTNFSVSSNVYSVDSNDAVQGVGYIQSIARDDSHQYIGLNAEISTAVKTSGGIATKLDLISSGYGYANGQVLTLVGVTNTSALAITGIAQVSREGLDSGYWKNNNGKLNSDKYIHDNDYYQEFSYEIRSPLSIDQYADMVKSVIHLAGTKMFGKTIIQTEQDINVSTPGVEMSLS